MKRWIIMAGLMLGVLLIPMAGGGFTLYADASAEVTDVGNTMCPVGGDKVSGTDFLVYEGKRYGLCCAMCEGKFKKNPQKYIAKMMEEEPALAQ